MKALLILSTLLLVGCMQPTSYIAPNTIPDSSAPWECSQDIKDAFYNAIDTRPELSGRAERERYVQKIETLYQCELGFRH